MIEGQLVDSRGKPRIGRQPYLEGKINGKWFGPTGGQMSNKNGHFDIRAPKGLMGTQLVFIRAQRFRDSKGER